MGAGIVVLLALVNIAGLRASAQAQNWLTMVEVPGLVAVAWPASSAPAAPATPVPAAFATTPPVGLFGLAMVFVLLTYGGWNEAAYLSAELAGGRRAIVPVLIVALAIITAAYLAVNVALLHGLGLAGLAASKAPGADVVARAFGATGATCWRCSSASRRSPRSTRR